MEDIVIIMILKLLKKKSGIMRSITGEKREAVGKITFLHLIVRKTKWLQNTLFYFLTLLYFLKIIGNLTKLI